MNATESPFHRRISLQRHHIGKRGRRGTLELT